MDMSQGMLPPQGQAAPVTPVAPQGQAAPVTPVTPVAPQGQTPPQMGVPQEERDYQSNPLNDDDKDNLDKFQIMATKLIHTPQTREKVLDRIRGMDNPYNEIADAAYGVISRVDQQGKKEGKPFDKAVLIAGGVNVIGQVAELAQVAGKLKVQPTENDMKVITAKVVQKYYKEKMATGEISKEQAARDAHIAASANAADSDTSQLEQRVNATQQMKNDAVNAPEKGLTGPQGMVAPQQNDPFKPKATMKETLATGQGGLLNGVS